MIQAATGATIRVCPGRYSMIFVERDVTLLGSGSGTDPATSTIIDGRGVGGNVVQVYANTTVEFRGIRITNGNAFFGAGIWNKGDLTLVSCAVDNNVASTQYGGGIFNSFQGSLTMTDTSVSGNQALEPRNGEGGGIFNDGELTMTGCTVVGNSCATYGGGIYNLSPMTLKDCTVSRNTAMFGGGINASNDITLDNTEVSENTATRDNGGGGIYIPNTQATATLTSDTHVVNNTPNDCGGHGTYSGTCGT